MDGLNKEEEAEIAQAMPIDFSFKNISNFLELKQDKPRGGRVGKAPNRGRQKKFLTKSIWLGNNNLTNIENFDLFVESQLEAPELLGWIDFSFNQIKEIDESLLRFPNLKIIYFHGNNIETLDTVIKLNKLKNLKRLTLHGNPVASEEGYRNYLIHIIPQLTNLDFAPVIKAEKLAPVPAGSHKKFPDIFKLCD